MISAPAVSGWVPLGIFSHKSCPVGNPGLLSRHSPFYFFHKCFDKGNLHNQGRACVTLHSRVAMTGISEELTLVKILFWPGGQASTRRKHRLGYLCSWCTHSTSAGGGRRGQPRPPP